MSVPVTLLGGAALGMAAGSLLVPLTRRELAAAVARLLAGRRADSQAPARRHLESAGATGSLSPSPRVSSRPTCCTEVGWSPNALPPLLLLVGLVQLAYCDLTRRLLPKTFVYALSAAVIASGVTWQACMQRVAASAVASLGGLAFFALFFVINLMNPRWMAFGDVRLALVVGFGLAWVSPLALLQAFLFANLLAVDRRVRAHRRAPGRAPIRPVRSASISRSGPAGPAHLELKDPTDPGRRQNLHVAAPRRPRRPAPMVNSTRRPGRDAPAGIPLDLRMVHEEVVSALVLHEPVTTRAC